MLIVSIVYYYQLGVSGFPVLTVFEKRWIFFGSNPALCAINIYVVFELLFIEPFTYILDQKLSNDFCCVKAGGHG